MAKVDALAGGGPFGVRVAGTHARRIDAAGCDGVDADADRSKLESERSCEAEDVGLGRVLTGIPIVLN
jgi:hypothetical protein